MKKINFLLITLIIAVISVSGCISFDSNLGNDDTTLIQLNESNVTQITSINEIKKINNESSKQIEPTNDLISKDVYVDFFRTIFGNEVNTTVNGPYVMDNGTIYYTVVVKQKYDDGTIYNLYMDMDARVKPEDIPAQGYDFKGVISEYYSEYIPCNQEQVNPKVSEKEILSKATALYDKYRDYPLREIELFTTNDNQLVYVIDLGSLVYDANTGDLVYCDSDFNEEVADFASEPKCRELAQERLNNMSIEGAYLGEPTQESEMGGFEYKYPILLNMDGETVEIGYIYISPFDLTIDANGLYSEYDYLIGSRSSSNSTNIDNTDDINYDDIDEYDDEYDEYYDELFY